MELGLASHTLSRLFLCQLVNYFSLVNYFGDPEKPRILILAPTGVAATNIDGTTIHTALGINVGHKLYPLNDRQRGILRNKLSEIKFIIIDEISMVSSVLFYQVHQRLNEIFGVSTDLPFAGLPVPLVVIFINYHQLKELQFTLVQTI